MLKTPLKFLITIVLTLGLSMSFQSLLASWTAPTASPPNNNVPEPINVGSDPQEKYGLLTLLDGLSVASTTILDGDLLVDSSSIFVNSGNVVVPDGDVTALSFIGSGVGLTGIQKEITQSCSSGASIRAINSDGTVDCQLAQATPGSGSTSCVYTTNEICPTGTVMAGYVRGGIGTFDFRIDQIYCCGSTASTCTFQDWTNDGPSYCDASCVGYTCGTVSGYTKQPQTKINTNCLIETREVTIGSCNNSCGTCSTGYNCISNNCVCNDVCTYCRGGIGYTNSCGTYCECASTPYLFTGIAGNYYIENDVMATLFDSDYLRARDIYENSKKDQYGNFDILNKETDKYILTNNPSNENGLFKFRIKEIEPEESHFDEIKLIRVLYDNEASLIIDKKTNKIRSIKEISINEAINGCNFYSNGEIKENCQSSINSNDNNKLLGDFGDELLLNLNIKNLKDKKTYISFSWGSAPIPYTTSVGSRPIANYSLSFYDNNENEIGRFPQIIYPRALRSTDHIDITEIISNLATDQIIVKILWHEEYWIDKISIVTSEEQEYRYEELLLIKAEHSSGDNLLSSLRQKDIMYGSTKQGEEIDLEFLVGTFEVNDNEKEAYVFILSGFYNALRPELYPDLKIDNEWQKRIDSYSEDLNNIK